MKETNESTKERIVVTLPVKIAYTVLENYLREKLQGKVLSKDDEKGGKTSYAVVQGLSLGKSGEEDYDLGLVLELKMLTSFFKNREMKVVVHANLQFIDDEQEVCVQDYKVRGDSSSWFVNKFVQSLANTFMYTQLKRKMKISLKPVIEKYLVQFNEKLQNTFEVREGIEVYGNFPHFKICEIIPGQNYLLVSVHFSGSAVVNVKKIEM